LSCHISECGQLDGDIKLYLKHIESVRASMFALCKIAVGQ